MKDEKQKVLDFLKSEFGSSLMSRKDIKEACARAGFKHPRWIFSEDQYRVGRGKYSIATEIIKGNVPEQSTPKLNNPVPVVSDTISDPASSLIEQAAVETYRENLVPAKDPLFVKHGDYDLLTRVISSKIFYPVFITGLSGNGKTFAVEQACSETHRELYRVNITIETDEDDLLGGFRLVNDSTKWFDGPVVRAMKSGGVLLLDEVDLASTKILCLQPVLEGKGILLKKINQYIKPAPGFTVIATANTKGQGSESGKFVGTNILNEAFLERFCATFEQRYPTEKTEKKILAKLFSKYGLNDSHIEDFINKLVTWAFGTRKTFEEGGVSDLISTRRLVHIANAYVILGHHSDDKKKIGKNRKQAIELCVARFDESTKAAFLSLYENLDVYLNPELEVPPVEVSETVSEEPEEDIVSILGTNL